jgi:hypothetical protein
MQSDMSKRPTKHAPTDRVLCRLQRYEGLQKDKKNLKNKHPAAPPIATPTSTTFIHPITHHLVGNLSQVYQGIRIARLD